MVELAAVLSVVENSELAHRIDQTGVESIELVFQRPRQTHRGNRPSDDVISTKCCRHQRILRCAASRRSTISPAPGEVKPLATEWDALVVGEEPSAGLPAEV